MHWLKEKKFDEAERLLEQALALSPDGWIFDALAQTYQATGQIDRWKKALDDFLKTEDLALDHAHATDNLARYRLEAGKFEQARPYAEASAASGAGWAMIGAVMKAISDDPKPTAPKTARLIGILREWLAKGEKSPLDLEPIDAILAEIAAIRRPNTEAILGVLLDRLGKGDVALTYLKHANVQECVSYTASR